MLEILIKNIKVKSKIGVSLKERKQSQLLLISLKINYMTKRNKNVDEIKNLKDYSKIIKYIRKYVQNSCYRTLEKLLEELSKNLKKQFKLKKIYLTISKPEVAKKYRCELISVSK
tara:strand:+ start:199 stop:543 length:345 start_codon:yes stop_codon:yes gene_type:complete